MIETADHAGVAVLALAHGPVNALDLELLTAVPEVLATVAGARAVVLTGRGRAFSAGVDLKRIVEGGPEYVERFLPALSAAALALFEHPRPVVAAVNGHALAGGCVLAAACDARLMSGGTIGLTELAAGVPFPTVPLEIMRHAAGPALEAMVLGAGWIPAGPSRSAWCTRSSSRTGCSRRRCGAPRRCARRRPTCTPSPSASSAPPRSNASAPPATGTIPRCWRCGAPGVRTRSCATTSPVSVKVAGLSRR
ncbi:enoyl-CoA hydratase/isomerase family protein [[Actinomadura] parvosata]|uniref:enoyl-CoA hydratase/isomerase family protein n=1 Tax=[Actinomadura] parvosata TaxID=1955412 RepID=UPI00406CECE8